MTTIKDAARKALGRDVDAALEARISALEDAMAENRRLNERLSDLVDLVTELLIPLGERNDYRVTEVLTKLKAR